MGDNIVRTKTYVPGSVLMLFRVKLCVSEGNKCNLIGSELDYAPFNKTHVIEHAAAGCGRQARGSWHDYLLASMRKLQASKDI
jgi:hypothetical protein